MIKDVEVQPVGCICELSSDIPPNYEDILSTLGYTMISKIHAAFDGRFARLFCLSGGEATTLNMFFPFAPLTDFTYLWSLCFRFAVPLRKPCRPLYEIGNFGCGNEGE